MSRVLIVEDDPLLLCILEEIIFSMGHEVDAVSNGQCFFDALSRASPDLITLDYVLPDTTGSLILATIRRTPSLQHIPVIFITASQLALESIPSDLYQAIIPKPFDIQHLEDTIRRYI